MGRPKRPSLIDLVEVNHVLHLAGVANIVLAYGVTGWLGIRRLPAHLLLLRRARLLVSALFGPALSLVCSARSSDMNVLAVPASSSAQTSRCPGSRVD